MKKQTTHKRSSALEAPASREGKKTGIRQRSEVTLSGKMAELSQDILRAESLEEISELTLEKALKLTDSPFGYVGYIDPATGHLVAPTLTHTIWDQCLVEDKDIVFKEFTGLWGWVLEHKKPLLTNNPGKDDRSTGVPHGHIPITRFLSVPVMSGTILKGQIALANAESDYTETDLRLLERLASIFAVGIDHMLIRKSLHDSIQRYKDLFEEDLTGDFVADPDGTILFCNKAFRQIAGLTDESECRKTNISGIFPTSFAARRFLAAIRRRKKLVLHEQRMIRADGKEIYTVGNYSGRFGDQGRVTEITGYVYDITRRKQAELRRELITDILAALNRPNHWQTLIREILERVKRFTGLETAGIRLRKGEDYSYFEISGFSEQFIRKENTLCLFDPTGKPVRDADGVVMLDCMCGRVISGQPEPAENLFTAGGSYWTNELQTLKENPDGERERLFPRGTCISEGYNSLALIPLKSGEATIGLLQICDRRPNLLDAGLISFFEEIASTVGIAYQRISQELKIREEKERFHTFFDNLVIGVYQTTYDGRILMANPSLVSMLGFPSEEDLKLRNLQEEGFEPGYNRDEFLQRIEREGEIIGLESTWKRNDGETLHVRESARCVRDETGNVRYYEGTVEDITREKLAEDALRVSEMQFRLLFENAPFPRWVYDVETLAFLEVNKAAVEKYGYSRDEFLTMTLRDIRPPEEIPLLINNVETVKDDIQFSRGWHHKTKSGSILEVEISSHATLFNGRNARVVLAHDVTEQRRHERDLRETKEYLEKLLNFASAPIVTLQADLSLRGINHAMVRLTGYSGEELMQGGFRIVLPASHHILVEELIERIRQGDQMNDLEIPILTKEGKIRHTLWSSANIYNEETGDLTSVIVIGTDITERKAIHEELLASERLLNGVIESLPVGVWITDDSGMIVRGNKAGQQIWAGARYIGPEQYGEYKGWWRSTGEPVRAEEWAAARAVQKGETSIDEEIEIECFDGTNKIILNSAIPIRNDRKEITGAVIMNQDITDRVKAQERIAEANRDLQRSKLLIEESDRLKTSLLNNMSHEFRTPMNAILGFSSLLETEILEEAHRQMASRINQAGNRLMKTLDDILELSLLQAQGQEDHAGRLDLHTELTEILPRYRELAGKKGLQVVLEESGTRPVVSIDREHFRRVVDHLVDNAVKFTEQGRISLRISFEQQPDGEAWAVLSIADTGIGIPPEQQSLIFEEFRQVSEGYGRTYEGTGLGLTIAQKILAIYNGTISVESEPGKGSEFIIRLPACEAPVRPDAEARPGMDRRRKTGVPQTTESGPRAMKDVALKILVVEDNEDNVEVIRYQLAGQADPDVAGTADEAIEMAGKTSYDLILMDINLGAGKNGLDATREIRQLPGYAQTPVIAVTGYTSAEDKNRIFAAGCSHYLGKPFTKQQLLNKITEAQR